MLFETQLAKAYEKTYDIMFPKDVSEGLCNTVEDSLEHLDLTGSKVSVQQDKTLILEYANGMPGGIHAFNASVKGFVKKALSEAEISLAAIKGDLKLLQNIDFVTLTKWRNIRGRSITHVAAHQSRVEAMIQTLQRTHMAHLDLQDAEGCTPLSIAAACGGLTQTLALLHFGADPRKATRVGLTPLHFAAAYGYQRIAVALLEARADIEALGAFAGLGTCSPLMAAASQGHASVVRALGSCMADVEARNTVGASALTAAASRGQTEVLAALISLKASIEEREATFDRNALMVAIQNAQPATVGLLLSAKAGIPLKEGAHFCLLCERLDRTAAHDIWGMLKKSQQTHGGASTMVHGLEDARELAATYTPKSAPSSPMSPSRFRSPGSTRSPQTLRSPGDETASEAADCVFEPDEFDVEKCKHCGRWRRDHLEKEWSAREDARVGGSWSVFLTCLPREDLALALVLAKPF